MKRKFKSLKGFTLIELVVVMAIMVSVLTAILQLMDPVQEAYRDSTIYEQQRTVENGIISYLAESTRYAKAISIIDQGVKIDRDGNGTLDDPSVDDLETAANYFIVKNGLKVSDYKNIEVIVIDRSTKFEYKGKEVQGRLVRIRGLGDSSLDVPSWSNTVSESDLESADWTTSDCYMAMGPEYYGEVSYEILLTNDWDDTDSDGKADPLNQLQRGFDMVVFPKTAQKNIETKTNGSVTSMNYFVTPAFIDYQTYITSPASGTAPTGREIGALAGKSGDPNEDKDTYIFFLRPDV